MTEGGRSMDARESLIRAELDGSYLALDISFGIFPNATQRFRVMTSTKTTDSGVAAARPQVIGWAHSGRSR